MQAIRTRKLPATDKRDTRIAAQTSSGIRRVFPFQYEMDDASNHFQAALSLAEELGWITDAAQLTGGTFQEDYYWVH